MSQLIMTFFRLTLCPLICFACSQRCQSVEMSPLYAMWRGGVLEGGSGVAAAQAWHTHTTSAPSASHAQGSAQPAASATPHPQAPHSGSENSSAPHLTECFSFAPVEAAGGSFRVSVEHAPVQMVALLEVGVFAGFVLRRKRDTCVFV